MLPAGRTSCQRWCATAASWGAKRKRPAATREGVRLVLRRKTLRMQLAGPRDPVVVVTTIDLSRGKVSSAKNGREKTCTDTQKKKSVKSKLIYF